MAAPEHRPSRMRVDRLLGEHGMQEDTPTSRAQFEQWMERRRLEETDPEALKSELAQLHARGRCRQRGPGATGHVTNGAARNDPSYGLRRAMRVEYAGTIYHVMDRGDRREDTLIIGTAKGG